MTFDPREAEVEKRDAAQLVNCCEGGGCSDVCFYDEANLPARTPEQICARNIDVVEELVSRFGNGLIVNLDDITATIRKFPAYSRQALADEYLNRSMASYYEHVRRESLGRP